MVKKKQEKINFCECQFDARKFFLIIIAIIAVSFIIIFTLIWSLNIRVNELMNVPNKYNYRPVSSQKATNNIAAKTDAAQSLKPTLEKKDNVLTVRIKADHKPNRIFEGESDQNEKTPLLDVLSEIKDAKGLQLEYETVGNRTAVKTIDGIDVKDTYKLAYYVNGQLVTGDLSGAKVGIGDIVEIVTL